MCVWHGFAEKELEVLFWAPIMSVANLLSDQIVRVLRVMVLNIGHRTLWCNNNIYLFDMNIITYYSIRYLYEISDLSTCFLRSWWQQVLATHVKLNNSWVQVNIWPNKRNSQNIS